MKYFGEASAFKQFTNWKGINFYPIDRGTWYGTSPDNGYVKKLGKNTSEYVSIKFEELDSYLKSLENNTPETSYKIKVIDIPESGIGESSKLGTLGYILNSNQTKYVSLKFDNSLDNVTNAGHMFYNCALIAYYSSEDDNLYKNYRDVVGGNITWVKNK